MRCVWFLGFCLILQSAMPGMSTAAPRSRKSASRDLAAQLGSIEDGVYHNSVFSFTYKIPFGWVDRSDDMRRDSGPAKDSLLLLAVFERPPQATGDTVNSAVVITAERMDSYPGLKTAADYFGPLTELSKAKGFSVVNEPYEILVGRRRLVRGDFSKALNSNVTMRQSSLVTLAGRYVVSFTFIASTEDETDKLISNLSFSPTLRSKP